MICDRVSELKTKKTTLLMLVILKNYEYLNELQGAISSEYIIITVNTRITLMRVLLVQNR